MTPSFFALSVPQEKITVFLYMSEIENYNSRIERNLLVNERRWKQYRLSVVLFLILPAFLAIVYGIMGLIF